MGSHLSPPGVGKIVGGGVASIFVLSNASAADIEVPKKVMLLHNPTAGASHPNAETLLKSIRKAIGVKPSYFSIKNADWKDALSKRWDAVILAGGDGTVGKSVRWLRDRMIPIAILPLGTANNIARSLGIEGDLEFCCRSYPLPRHAPGAPHPLRQASCACSSRRDPWHGGGYGS